LLEGELGGLRVEGVAYLGVVEDGYAKDVRLGEVVKLDVMLAPGGEGAAELQGPLAVLFAKK
jgi:hypothetical protein